VVLLAAGCTGSYGGRHQVSGEITLDGKPLAGGWVYFRPLQTGPTAASEVQQGRFRIPARQGLAPGTYRVAIEYLQPTGRMVKAYTGEQVEERKQVVPRRYNEQTELTAEVDSGGDNRFTFELQSD
jgi:hypothetical protein